MHIYIYQRRIFDIIIANVLAVVLTLTRMDCLGMNYCVHTSPIDRKHEIR